MLVPHMSRYLVAACKVVVEEMGKVCSIYDVCRKEVSVSHKHIEGVIWS